MTTCEGWLFTTAYSLRADRSFWRKDILGDGVPAVESLRHTGWPFFQERRVGGCCKTVPLAGFRLQHSLSDTLSFKTLPLLQCTTLTLHLFLIDFIHKITESYPARRTINVAAHVCRVLRKFGTGKIKEHSIK